jgi:hypothetical protein
MTDTLCEGDTGSNPQPTMLELHDANNWEEAQAIDLQATGLAPGGPHESATLGWLTPGAYTAVVRGSAEQSGVGLLSSIPCHDPEI